MGRTLHWEITPRNGGKFTKNDLHRFYNVSEMIRSKCNWTCGTFTIDIGIFPNWGKGLDWDTVNRRADELFSQSLNHIDVELELIRGGIALPHNPYWWSRIYGFCKVGGNELNAMWVVRGLTQVSIEVKKATIAVRDEGNYLLCPIIIEEGMARPDDRRIDSDIAWWMTRRWYPEYADAANWESMSKSLWELKEKYHSRYFPPKCEWVVETFCRHVNPADFDRHPEYSAGSIMAGFEGEYYGLTDKDPVFESLKVCAQIKELLPEGATMEVAPRPRRARRKK